MSLVADVTGLGQVDTIRTMKYFDTHFCDNFSLYELDTSFNYFIEIDSILLNNGLPVIGRFECTLIHDNCDNGNDTLKITDGRFKVPF